MQGTPFAKQKVTFLQYTCTGLLIFIFQKGSPSLPWGNPEPTNKKQACSPESMVPVCAGHFWGWLFEAKGRAIDDKQTLREERGQWHAEAMFHQHRLLVMSVCPGGLRSQVERSLQADVVLLDQAGQMVWSVLFPKAVPDYTAPRGAC